jgi:hypothetical protein
MSILAGALVLVGDASALASTPSPAACAASQVTLTAMPDHSHYTSNTMVVVTVALHNRSSSACSYTVGPFSPNFVLTNDAGTTVWASCWFGGGPAPCAYYLLHRTLAPKSTYRDRLTWDQRTGHPDQLVPAGRYSFKVNFVGLARHATTSFTLSRGATANVADSGHRLCSLSVTS